MDKKRICIIGGGPAGLINLSFLKNGLDSEKWDIFLYEKSDKIGGAWAWKENGFMSTSTKFATQFATFARYTDNDGYFENNEYGKYLSEFVKQKKIKENIHLNSTVSNCNRILEGWTVEINKKKTFF